MLRGFNAKMISRVICLKSMQSCDGSIVRSINLQALKQSNDHSHRSGHNRYDSENDIPQVCHGDVFQIVISFGFHRGSLAITRGDWNCPARGEIHRHDIGPCRKIAVIFRLLEVER